MLTRAVIDGVSEDPVADVLLLRIGRATTLRLLWWSSSEHGEYLVIQDRVLKAVAAALATKAMWRSPDTRMFRAGA